MADPVPQLLTKSELAYNRVREKILSGEFPPGSVINQTVLAGAIGISTTPLREALRRLKAEGLVELDAHRDARVTELRAEEARDLVEMRGSLDPLAAALAAQRRTRTDLAEIRDALGWLTPLSGNPGYEQLLRHRRFHRAIYLASHNDLLIETLEGLWDKADRYRRLALEVDRPAEANAKTAEEHQLLLDHIAVGDADAAAGVMREHIGSSLGAQAAWRLRKS